MMTNSARSSFEAAAYYYITTVFRGSQKSLSNWPQWILAIKSQSTFKHVFCLIQGLFRFYLDLSNSHLCGIFYFRIGQPNFSFFVSCIIFTFDATYYKKYEML